MRRHWPVVAMLSVAIAISYLDRQTLPWALQAIQAENGFESLRFDDQIGKVSLVGAGMRSHPGVSATFFSARAAASVNVEMISTSEIRISVVCRDTDLDVAVRAVHDAFDLGSTDEQAVVYGGTGR